MQRSDDSYMDIDDSTLALSEAQGYQISSLIISENDESLSNNSFVTYSTCHSSAVGTDAVGVADGDKEETINTRLATIDLSMMFSSPVLGMNRL